MAYCEAAGRSLMLMLLRVKRNVIRDAFITLYLLSLKASGGLGEPVNRRRRWVFLFAVDRLSSLAFLWAARPTT